MLNVVILNVVILRSWRQEAEQTSITNTLAYYADVFVIVKSFKAQVIFDVSNPWVINY